MKIIYPLKTGEAIKNAKSDCPIIIAINNKILIR